MAKAEMMKKFILLSVFSFVLCACGTQYNWSKIEADAHRTGVVPAGATNSREALGYIEDGVYHAPSGREFAEGSTARLAGILIDAQPEMAYLKQVIAYAPEAMSSHRPQSELSNFAADCVKEGVEKVTGEKVDVSIINFGGIRCAVPQGDVLLDDIVSMFPFKNYLVYVEVSGERLREIFTQMARRKVEAIGGDVQVVVEGHSLASLKVNGEEVRDDRTYGIGSIDFLLQGGDKIHLADGAQRVVRTDVLVRDCILDRIYALSKEGLPLEYHLDNRIVEK